MNGEPKKEGIDWALVHQRVEAARQATERGGAPPLEERKRVLHERAQALARIPTAPPSAVARFDVVVFSLAQENYGIELPFIREVYPLKSYTPLPCTPAFVLGLINVRGQIVSVIELGRFFDLPRVRRTESSKVIILQKGEMEVGVVADAVLGVQAVRKAEIRPGLPTLTGIRETYLKGITAERLVLLDADRLLSEKSIVVQEHVEE